jgi:hypothetical protein
MASYTSYKKLASDSFADDSVDAVDFTSALNTSYGVKWVYGDPGFCSAGCCCLWTVPAGVRKLQIQLWGAGGNGVGACSCSRCHHYMGAGGGYYNVVTIDTAAGCEYTICAGGVYPCLSRECTACVGCASYVNGYNLSSFCAVGGCQGLANTCWAILCNSQVDCCLAPGSNGGEWTQFTHTGNWGANEFVYNIGHCHCYNQALYSSGAALIGTNVTMSIRECWIRCGCWTVPYGNGGQNAMSTYCGGGSCGQGGTGGPGLVKITYF